MPRDCTALPRDHRRLDRRCAHRDRAAGADDHVLTSDAGSVTVEAAFAVGTLAVVLVAVLAAMGAMVLQLRCLDAAGEAARLAARDDPEGARRAAARLLPGGAEVTVEVRGDAVVVRVQAPPLGSALPGVRVAAEAAAAREPASVAAVAGPDPLGTTPEDDAGSAAAAPPLTAGPSPPVAEPPPAPRSVEPTDRPPGAEPPGLETVR